MQTTTPENVGLSSARLARISAYFERYIAEHQAPGVITLVARRGKLAHLACTGAMSLETGQPLQPDTIFRIYSMTKPITCAALLMLFEEGRLLLDDPVARYLPGFANLKVLLQPSAAEPAYGALERPITIRDLLTHTAGLGYGLFEDSPVEDLYRAGRLLTRVLTLRPTLQGLVDQVTQLPLAHQPGQVWRYSVAHDVIAHLVATIADMPFATFLSERIFSPLGMADTGFSVPPEKQGRFASLYLRREAGQVTLYDEPATSIYVHPGTQPAGGGGLVSTVSDYLHFAELLLNRGALGDTRLLGRKTVELMTSNHLPERALPFRIGPEWSWDGYGFGLGVAVMLSPAQSGLPGSAGSFEWPGAAGTLFWVDPREELIALMMTQVLPAPPSPPIDRAFKSLVYQAIID